MTVVSLHVHELSQVRDGNGVGKVSEEMRNFAKHHSLDMERSGEPAGQEARSSLEGRRTSLENERAGKTIGNLTTSTRQPPGLVPSLASSPTLSNASRLRALSPSHHILHSSL